MAAVSSTILNFSSSFRPTFKLINGRFSNVKLVSFGMPKNGFPSLKSSCLSICCAAKPETLEKICGIVRKQLALPSETAVTPESKFSTFGADSLDTVEIVMAIEEEFNISVEEDSSQNITTVQEVADLVQELIEKKTEEA